jgi:hypothetical protein
MFFDNPAQLQNSNLKKLKFKKINQNSQLKKFCRKVPAQNSSLQNSISQITI